MKDEYYTPDQRSQKSYRSQRSQRSEMNRKEEDSDNAIPKPNLSIIESKDPSLIDGFKIIYNKEVPLDIKLQTKEETKEVASYELIRCKLLSDILNNEGVPQRVKLELSWENDLLFHYTNIVDEMTFLDMKKKQNLNIDFPQYCDLVMKICDNCIKDPKTYIGELTIQKDGISKLLFIKGSEFKFLELLSLEFKNSPDELIKKHMIYRIAYIKSKLEYDKKALNISGDVILECNPDIMNPILEANDNYNLDINKFFGLKKVEEKGK